MAGTALTGTGEAADFPLPHISPVERSEASRSGRGRWTGQPRQLAAQRQASGQRGGMELELRTLSFP